MTSEIVALCFDAQDPRRLARFWGGLLGWEAADDPRDGVVLLPSDDTGFNLRFLPTQEPKVGRNRTHLDIGQRPDEDHVVLADPEGNEFCVIEPGNAFLADCDFIGAVNGDGPQEVGYFWSEALGWPLVWDQDQETAIRSPHGGPKFAWGGPPVLPKPRKNRLHLDLAPHAGGDQRAEVDRLISLGAGRVDIGQGDVDWVVLADPDGNELCVLPPP